MSAPITHSAAAASLAALLPARRGIAWQVKSTKYRTLTNTCTSHITDGFRSLIIIERAGTVEVYTDRPHDLAGTPQITVDTTGPDPVAALAAHVLRCTLPLLDKDRAAEAVRTTGPEQALADRVEALTEVAFALIDAGAHPTSTIRPHGEGLEWMNSKGGQWWMQAVNPSAALNLDYRGPINGLYALLPALLPPADGHTPTNTGTAFTRHLTHRFPQLRPLHDDEAKFDGYQQPHGWIATSTDTSTVKDGTPVSAQFSDVGPDLLLAAMSHLL
ncbi:hypothetical protein [Streptomyces sp. NPDC059611]|uniref:hypothetical protein n=1 Tax=Streptomyces sp. NPDC059611 TaxID=3346884 RepID=UPI0036AB46E8